MAVSGDIGVRVGVGHLIHPVQLGRDPCGVTEGRPEGAIGSLQGPQGVGRMRVWHRSGALMRWMAGACQGGNGVHVGLACEASGCA